MLSLALAGKPNAGKSTFFAAATMADVDVANYPFTTIDPNRGVSHVRTECPCLAREERCGDEHCHDGTRYVPIELLDVAGLVPGAHEGRGLGNQFLDELTNADVILNVVDSSGGTNAEGEPIEIGEHDPVEDVDFITEEIEQWLAGIIDRNWETIARGSRAPNFSIDEALREMLSGVGAGEATITATLRVLDYPTDPREWTDDHRFALAREIRERTKPLVVVANKADVAPEGALDALRDAAGEAIPATAEGELALRRGAEAGAIEYDPGIPSSPSSATSPTASARGWTKYETSWPKTAAPASSARSIPRSTTCSTTSPCTPSRTRRSGPTAKATSSPTRFSSPEVRRRVTSPTRSTRTSGMAIFMR